MNKYFGILAIHNYSRNKNILLAMRKAVKLNILLIKITPELKKNNSLMITFL